MMGRHQHSIIKRVFVEPGIYDIGVTEDDAALAASMEPAQPIQTPISTLDERIASEIVNPTDQKVRGVGIGLKRSSRWAQHFDKAEQI